ncbi:MAG: Phosphoesterase PA-phosphatase related protein [Candidatus Saccharibacteria bacterium]|jgi:undecaprenyl-diphosphatase|nr:Phosphoesterase PA-phosphatase related protein [Candidatus Saccharibacteria bacterium]
MTGWFDRRRARIKPLQPLAIPGLLVAGLMTLTVALGSLAWFDRWMTRAVNRLPEALHPFFTVIAAIGHWPSVIVVAFAVATIEAADKRWMRAGVMLGSLLALPTFYAVKELVQRARPVTEFVTAHGLHDYSFPSGHTTGSTAVYGLAAILIAGRVPQDKRKWVYLGFGTLIFLIGVSRVYLGAHFPTDVLGGWILGIVFVSILRTVTLAFAKLAPPDRVAPQPLEDTTEAELSGKVR